MMQMTTKLWATHYNQHNPPKKVCALTCFCLIFQYTLKLILFFFDQVDIVQMSVLEFKDRPGRPYYHLERFIVGD